MPHDDLCLKVALGKGDLGSVGNKTVRWAKLREKLSTPLIDTAIVLREYLELSKTQEGRDEQNRRKGMPGFLVGGFCKDGKRALKAMTTGSIVCLDIDEATPQQIEWLLSRSPLLRYEFAAHTTRKHTDRHPRLRLIAPLSREVDHQEFNAVSRILAAKTAADQDEAMEMVDDVSFRMAQIMYLPSVSSDQEFIFHHNKGDLADPDTLLGDFKGDWHDYTQLPHSQRRGAKGATDPNAKAEDPTTKRGIVGAFCRAFDVEEAIAEFLPNVYEPSSVTWTKPRYTYSPGSGANGAEVQDDGLFLYSHHGTDPCAERLVTSFDLVRIHLFRHLDEKVKEGTPPTAMPSYKAMVERFANLPAVRDERMQDRYDPTKMFNDLVRGGDEDEAAEEKQEEIWEERQEARHDNSDILGPETPEEVDDADAGFCHDPGPQPDDKLRDGVADWDWMRQLQVTDKGIIVRSVSNLVEILRNEPRFADVMRFNEFSGEVVRRAVVRSKNGPIIPAPVSDPIMGDIWSGNDDATVRIILDMSRELGGYELRPSRADLTDAINQAAKLNGFHPVKERIEAVHWDGVERAERLFIDYLGSPDTPYIREVTRSVLLGALTRIYEPGHKFDFVAVLEGLQGAGKSTFIKTLAWDFFAELDGPVADRNKCVEQMLGAWLMEIPELSSFNRGEVNEIKSLVSATSDKVRLAYERRAVVFPRQCIFLGTSNDRQYLKDATGGRRFWPVEVTVGQIDNPRLLREVGQVWAEVLTWYRAMREAQPKGSLPLYLRDEEAQTEALERQEDRRRRTPADDMEDEILAWLNARVSKAEALGCPQFGEEGDADVQGEELGVRDRAFTKDIMKDCLGWQEPFIRSDRNYQNFQNVISNLPGWTRHSDRRRGSSRDPKASRGAVVVRNDSSGLWWRPVPTLPENDDDILGSADET